MVYYTECIIMIIARDERGSKNEEGRAEIIFYLAWGLIPVLEQGTCFSYG
ncbi:hypothetical protein SAMN04488692_1133 [Halarsenatibacter silvermanii]|uniref:Uncharacterized protein n=1 Tax=Halarsenatibacter silvermanii TaxID=321763 RepID=A0A1G9PH80_9FIRM|nr:hypothetical protein SAMN04488692_1133 [Halarsenatibacter silvermanii]